MNYIAAKTSPAENDSDNVYKKKNLYTLLHRMNGGFIFFLPDTGCSLTVTFQVYGADKNKHPCKRFHVQETTVKMSVEFEGKQNT